MSKLFKSFFTLVLFVCMVFTNISTVHADMNKNYTTLGFVTNIKVNKDYTFDVEEKIDVNFSSPSHGIFRAIPVTYGRYDIKDIKVKGYKYDVVNGKVNNKVNTKIIKIGDKNTLVTGRKGYVLTYKIVGYNTTDNLDTLRINLFPTNWETPIDYAKTTITMFKPFKFNESNLYYGSYGETTKLETVKDKFDNMLFSTGSSMTIVINNMPANTGASLVQKVDPKMWEDVRNNTLLFYLAVLLMFIFSVYSFVSYLRIKNNTNTVETVEFLRIKNNTNIVEVIEFKAPKDLTPADVGYNLEGSVSYKHLSATIIYMANKGYITIEEDKFGSYVLHKEKAIDVNEKNYVVELYDAFFSYGDSYMFSRRPTSEMQSRIYNVKKMVSHNFKGNKDVFVSKYTVLLKVLILLALDYLFFVTYSKVSCNSSFSDIHSFYLYRFMFVIVFSASYFIAFLRKYSNKTKIVNIFVNIAMVLANVAMAYCLILDVTLPIKLLVVFYLVITSLCVYVIPSSIRRSKYNLEILGHILGFKTFIAKAEVSRLKLLAEDDPSYFYDILPYAYIFGLSDVWIGKFDSMGLNNPLWYNSYDNRAFNNVMLVNCMDSFSQDLFKAVEDDMKSSDYSGGGYTGGSGNFSGGGFGGGGGGAW